MPFTSKKQWRAAFAGKIPGVDPHEWAHETESFKKLPERAPAEKGKPTLRSKKAFRLPEAARRRARQLAEESDLMERVFAQGANNALSDQAYALQQERAKRAKRASGSSAALVVGAARALEGTKTSALLETLAQVFKTAALGTSVMNPRNVGKLRGMMTTHALKAPGYAASKQAVNPRKNVIAAMNANKPH